MALHDRHEPVVPWVRVQARERRRAGQPRSVVPTAFESTHPAQYADRLLLLCDGEVVASLHWPLPSSQNTAQKASSTMR